MLRFIVSALKNWFLSVLGSKTFHADVHAGGRGCVGVLRYAPGEVEGGKGLRRCSYPPSTPCSPQCWVVKPSTQTCMQVGVGEGRKTLRCAEEEGIV